MEFQLKLALDGVRDLLLSPLSLIAFVADLISRREPPSHYFYDLLHLGRRTDHWIHLFGAADRVAAPQVPMSATEEQRVDALLGRVERAIVDQYERGGVTAQAKETLDRLLDRIQPAGAHDPDSSDRDPPPPLQGPET
ncbi:MAG: hypothetical protein ACE5IL_08045 [Myxococcota bacterium]